MRSGSARNIATALVVLALGVTLRFACDRSIDSAKIAGKDEVVRPEAALGSATGGTAVARDSTAPDLADGRASGGRRAGAAAAGEQVAGRDATTAPASEVADDVAKVECRVIDARTDSGIVGAIALLGSDAAGTAQPLVFETRTDPNGLAAWSGVPRGSYTLSVESPAHSPGVVSVRLDSAYIVVPSIALEPLPSVSVELLGGTEEDPTQYEVARIGHDARVAFDVDGRARLPLPDGALPDVTVHAPRRIEVSALYSATTAMKDPIVVRVAGGEQIDVHVAGASEDSRPLVLTLQFQSSLGYAAFVTVPTTSGSIESFDLGEPGDLFLDVGVNRPDRTLMSLGRAHTTVRSGRPTVVTVDIGSARTRAAFEGRPGERVLEGELFFGAAEGTAYSPAGGPLDATGHVIVPTQETREFLVFGHTRSDGRRVAVADVPVTIDTRSAGEPIVPLGEIVESELEVVDAQSGLPLVGRCCDIMSARTMGFLDRVTVAEAGAPVRVLWHRNGAPRFELYYDDVWSPRGLQLLEPGRQRIPVTLRADCTITTPGAKLADLQHVATGLTHTALAASEGVTVEELPNGRRYRGIPAGNYLARLEGEADWRGPFVVVSGAEQTLQVLPN